MRPATMMDSMRKTLICGLALAGLAIPSVLGENAMDLPGGGRLQLPERCGQVLLATTDSWASTSGQLVMMARRADGNWSRVPGTIAVTVGRSGLAPGRGLHRFGPKTRPEKAEGDGRAPAGIFRLGTAFGDKRQPFPMKVAYRQADDDDFFVDDVSSPDYNSWVVTKADPGTRWKSFERMRRKDHRYELGMVVRHNMNPVTAGKGSAIFLHVWARPGVPTAGCTAMARKEMVRILKWLDAAREPLFILAPASALRQLHMAPSPSRRKG